MIVNFLLAEVIENTVTDTYKYDSDEVNNVSTILVRTYDEDKVQELLQNAGIIRNQLKIRSAISNANAFMKVQEEFGSFSKYIWGFVDGKPMDNKPKTLKDVRATSAISDALSKDLKKRGFKFVESSPMVRSSYHAERHAKTNS